MTLDTYSEGRITISTRATFKPSKPMPLPRQGCEGALYLAGFKTFAVRVAAMRSR